MKSARIVVRLTPYQIARGLQIIRQLEPNYQLISVNDVVKTIYHDYISKMSINRSASVPQEIVNEVVDLLRNTKSTKAITIDDMLSLKADNQELEISQVKEKSELSDEILAEIEKITSNEPKEVIEKITNKASEFNDPNITESKISAVEDFSPPTDWKE